MSMQAVNEHKIVVEFEGILSPFDFQVPKVMEVFASSRVAIEHVHP